MKNLNRTWAVQGFTLVELLVVITIITVLASVVLSRLGGARQDGVDAKVRSELAGIARQASIIESSTLTFDATCGSNGVVQHAKIVELIASIDAISNGVTVCNSDTDAFAVSAPLQNGEFVCVDTSGTTQQIGVQIAAGILTCS